MNLRNLFQVRKAVQAGDVEELKRIRKYAKQTGFTLLELLVVVAILSAVAGTATIALQDTDARASAAAHVAMMDELNKGIRTYRVLNKNVLPTGFDSLIESDDESFTTPAVLSNAGIEDVAIIKLPEGSAGILADGGIDTLQYVNNTLDADGEESIYTCADLEGIIGSRANAFVAGNIFMSPDANGCGFTADVATDAPVAVWTGGYERVMGAAGADYDVTALTTDGTGIATGVEGAPVFMAVGLGPSSTLFNGNELGGLTSVPVYRHVTATQYNRFIALFNIGTVGGDGAGTISGDIDAGDQVYLVSIIDGAGDTKEEELGEWDGTRNTI